MTTKGSVGFWEPGMGGYHVDAELEYGNVDQEDSVSSY